MSNSRSHYIIAFASAVVLVVLLVHMFSTEKVSSSDDDDEREYIPVRVDSCDGIPMRIYSTGKVESIHLYCGKDIPDGTYRNQLFCAAAAFTNVGYENMFYHKLIAGDHVSEGVRYDGYSCPRNTGAFVYYNGFYKFLYKNYSDELDLAAQHHGMGFAQNMLVHNGLIVATLKGGPGYYRALCELNKELCVIENVNQISFEVFLSALLMLDVEEALYLDMGGWSYSWYRNIDGEVVRLYTDNKERLTNVIVFEGVN